MGGPTAPAKASLIIGNGDGAGSFGQAVTFHNVETHVLVVIKIFLFKRRASADEETHLVPENIMHRMKYFFAK